MGVPAFRVEGRGEQAGATSHKDCEEADGEEGRSELPNRDLAYLEQGTEEFDAYIDDLMWCQAFARHNRAEMMDRVLDAIGYHLGAVDELGAD